MDISLDEVIATFLGKSEEFFINHVEQRIGRKIPDSWTQETKELYKTRFESELQEIPGISNALDALPLPSCVASSGTHEKIHFTLGITGLLPRFEQRIYSATQVERGKPFPDLFLFAADQMNWNPEKCVVVEDSDAGIKAGLDAGMHVIGYNSGLQSHSSKRHPRLRLIHSMEELVPVVTGQLPWLEPR